MGDLKNTPVPSGPHTTKTVVNGNSTTDGMTTQPFYIGNAVSSGTDTATPKYPVPSKDELGYAQKSTPGSVGPPQPVPTGPHTKKDTVIGNATTDAFVTTPKYIGSAVPAESTAATPSYPSSVKLGYNQTSKKQTLAEESHSDSDSGEESDSNKDLVDPKNFI
jgi:hypothetical protein